MEEGSSDEGQENLQSIVGDYIVGKTLGEGSFGKVKLGIHSITNEKVALKLIEKKKASPKDLINIEREQKIAKLLDHPNIVKLKEVIEIKEKNVICLVLEYVTGGELFDYIVANRRLRESEAVKFFRQIISAVEYCHSNLVIHRDLKPENLLLDDQKNIKINDFGLSNFMKPGHFLETYCGSPLYSSPEIIQERGYLGPEIDIWAMGVILYAMVVGYLPWDGNDLREQVSNASKGKYVLPSHVSPECGDIIQRMLTVDPKKRANIAELRSHPWTNRGFQGPPPSCLPLRKPISNPDEEILQQLIQMGFKREEIIDDLKNGKEKSHHWVFYYLMLDQKEKQEKLKKSNAKIIQKDSPDTNNDPINENDKKLKNNNIGTRNTWTSESDLEKQKNPEVKTSFTTPPHPSSKNLIGTLFKKMRGISNIDDNTVSSNISTKDQKKKYRGSLNMSTLNNNNNDNNIKNDEKILRIVKGAFSVETTTTRSLDEIYLELGRVFSILKINFKLNKKATIFTCKSNENDKRNMVKFEIEICKIDKLNMKGLRFKRKKGELWNYQKIVEKFLQEVKL